MNDSIITLDDKYVATKGRVYLSGTQALVRLPMTQMRRDKAAGLNTASLVSGYRGSPLGSYDQQLMSAKKYLHTNNVTFQPGLNEDLAATAIWGTQQVGLSRGANRDGVLGIMYGKGPGMDRSGDVLKHGNAAGTSAHGGVLAFAGDDHTCKSSSIPHQSDHAFMSALMPVLYPSSIHEFLEIGLLGIAMSRYSGCWIGMKFISETVETTSVIDLSKENRQFILPTDFELPAGGLNLRWPDAPLVQDERLQEYKGYAALAFARANQVDEIILDTPNARLGIVATGKAYEDAMQALSDLGITNAEVQTIGLRIYKVRMTWPLEPEGIRQFSEGLEEVLIIEERREIIENQIKQQLFNWRSDVRPRIVGKFDHEDKPFLSLSKGLTIGAVARAIADRLLRLELPDGLREQISSKLQHLEDRQNQSLNYNAPVTRLPHYCAGCPHNTSTRVPEGSVATAGIGCHFMAQWMDRNTETFTHMGGEGVPWTAIGRYTDEKHRFANIGDGTYFHSGILAIRQSVSAKANITYKVLYNDAVAMTGGQPIDGILTPQQLTHQLYHERVAPIYLLTDKPENYRPQDLPPGVIIKHRDHIDAVMKEVREIEGCSAIVYEQTCAAELRRRRKRGTAETPNKRVIINPEVCEGCGDCSDQSNCIAIEPLETEFGRKRKINQSSCNLDFSCIKGFCPSFVTVHGGRLKRHSSNAKPDVSGLPTPELPILDRPWNIGITGVGGSGILTIGAILGMAAHIEGKSPMVMDMAGLAQKGGAVMSHIRISTIDNPATAPRIANGGADVLLAADSVVAASRDGISICDPERTNAVFNNKITPVSDFVRNPDFDFEKTNIEKSVESIIISKQHFHNFTSIAMAITGDEISTNSLMLGYAWQCGLIPISAAAIEQAVSLNGVAVQSNLDAFNWGRLFAHDPAKITSQFSQTEHPPTQDEMTIDELIEQRCKHLTLYQNSKLADKYRETVQNVRSFVTLKLSSSEDQEKVVRTIALNYSKLLSYKDEYEVARLFSGTRFSDLVANKYEGNYKVKFNFAPPFLPGTAPNGRPKKREFGAVTHKILGLLSNLKWTRGTALDVFGYTSERKSERALIKNFESDIDMVLNQIDDVSVALAIAILSLPDSIRGFGPVKEKSISEALQARQSLLKDYKSQQRS